MNSSNQRPGLLFPLVGPAGAGKNRLLNHVVNRTALRQLPTATTRSIRPGEQEGREHFYMSREAFQQKIAAGALLEHQVIHGNLYGMLRAEVEKALDSGSAIIADIEPLGAAHAHQAYPENVISIFIQPPSIGTLIQRMRERGEQEAEIGKRLLRVPQELAYIPECDYAILNDDFDRAAEKLYRIIQAELSGTRHSVPSDPVVDYRYRYEVQVVPFAQDQVLRRTAPPSELSAPLSTGEQPHAVALRGLSAALGLEPNEAALTTSDQRDGDYLPPARLDYYQDADGEHLRYVYFYRLAPDFAPPPGWQWAASDKLAAALRRAAPEPTR